MAARYAEQFRMIFEAIKQLLSGEEKQKQKAGC
jgi:hypothetical protein